MGNTAAPAHTLTQSRAVAVTCPRPDKTAGTPQMTAELFPEEVPGKLQANYDNSDAAR